jgi:hypothetical protein
MSDQGHNLPEIQDFQATGCSSDSHNLAANHSNTHKHGIGKINITPNISTNCIIIFYAMLREREFENYQNQSYCYKVMIY